MALDRKRPCPVCRTVRTEVDALRRRLVSAERPCKAHLDKIERIKDQLQAVRELVYMLRRELSACRAENNALRQNVKRKERRAG